jgi:polyisoprenoid-binding protein YceI
MKKVLITLAVLVLSSVGVHAQTKYFTKNGTITFFSKSQLEDIEAKNQKATCVIDTKTGAMEVAVLMKAFEFEKALMQEHFNENYVESDKYPKATLKAKIADITAVNFVKDGSYPVNITGKLLMHGVEKEVSAKGLIQVKNGKVSGNSEFFVKLSDHAIEIPPVVKDKVSNTIKINVAFWLEPLS